MWSTKVAALPPSLCSQPLLLPSRALSQNLPYRTTLPPSIAGCSSSKLRPSKQTTTSSRSSADQLRIPPPPLHRSSASPPQQLHLSTAAPHPYFNYMGMLAVEGTYDKMNAMLSQNIHPVDILLLMATSEGDKPKIEELLRAGAAHTVKDADERTAIDRAASDGIRDFILGFSVQKA